MKALLEDIKNHTLDYWERDGWRGRGGLRTWALTIAERYAPIIIKLSSAIVENNSLLKLLEGGQADRVPAYAFTVLFIDRQDCPTLGDNIHDVSIEVASNGTPYVTLNGPEGEAEYLWEIKISD